MFGKEVTRAGKGVRRTGRGYNNINKIFYFFKQFLFF